MATLNRVYALTAVDCLDNRGGWYNLGVGAGFYGGAARRAEGSLRRGLSARRVLCQLRKIHYLRR